MTKYQANLNNDRNCLHCLLNFMANFQLLGYNLSEKAYFKVGNIEEGSCKLKILYMDFDRMFRNWLQVPSIVICSKLISWLFRKVFCSNLSKVLIVSS